MGVISFQYCHFDVDKKIQLLLSRVLTQPVHIPPDELKGLSRILFPGRHLGAEFDAVTLACRRRCMASRLGRVSCGSGKWECSVS